MTTEPVNTQRQGINGVGGPNPLHPIYLPQNSVARNPVLHQQFLGFLEFAKKELLNPDATVAFLKEETYLKSNGVNVVVHPSRWPAAFQPEMNNLVINPELLELGQTNPDTLVFAVTEIFDQIIYAQLHSQSVDSHAIRIVPPPTPDNPDSLERLINIKAAKQDAIKAAVMGSTDTTAASATARQIVIDPYSAWHIAAPLHGVEAKAVDAFSKAMRESER
jgi:hypothetical protein